MTKKLTKEEELDQEVDKRCAKEVEDVLKGNGRALQPFIERTPFASIARVRLVKFTPRPEDQEAVEPKKEENVD